MTRDADDFAAVCLRGHDLDWREIHDEIVALDGRNAVYLALEGSGALLWRLLAESTTRHGLVQALITTSGIDAPCAAADVDEFLSTLNEHGLLGS
jgi:hypothetical protein